MNSFFGQQQGYACASFDWQLGDIGGREAAEQSIWPEGGVPQGAPAQSLEQFLIPLAVQATRAVLSWLAEDSSLDPARLGMSGISWGGYLTGCPSSSESSHAFARGLVDSGRCRSHVLLLAQRSTTARSGALGFCPRGVC